MIRPNSELIDSSAPSSTRAVPGNLPRTSLVNLTNSPERQELIALVCRAQAEEPSAQSELVLKYTRRIAGQVRLIINQPDAIEDVVQMVFIKMFRRLGRLRDPQLFESWLFRISRNTAVDFIRRRRCRPPTISGDDEIMNIADTNSTFATGEIMDAFEAALPHLNPTDRDLVKLFVAGNSYRHLAETNGLTLSTVKARLHRMRPFLRTFVGEATETRCNVNKGRHEAAA